MTTNSSSYLRREELSQTDHVLVVQGELDHPHHYQLQQALVELLKDPTVRIVVDLSECPYVGKDGLGAIVAAHKRMAETERPRWRLAVVAPTCQAQMMFNQTGLAKIIPIGETREEARRLLANETCGRGRPV